MHSAYHFIALHSIACHPISFSRSSTLFLKYSIQIWVLKLFFQKSILKPGFLFNILSFSNPRDLIFWNIFSENNLDSFQTQFQLISILRWGPFRWCRFWIPSFIKNLKNFRVLVGSGLFFQSPSRIKTLLFTTFLPVFEKTFQNLLFWPKFQSPSWIRTLLQESSRIRTLLQSFNWIGTLIFYSYFIYFQSNLSKSFKMSQKLRVSSQNRTLFEES